MEKYKEMLNKAKENQLSAAKEVFDAQLELLNEYIKAYNEAMRKSPYVKGK